MSLKLGFLGVVLAAGGFLSPLLPHHAVADELPHFFDAQERLARPDTSGLTRLRFVTTVDFPPFNQIDGSGFVSGYHVDLMRAICSELKLENICQIEAMPWGELVDHLVKGNADAIMAGVIVSEQNRERLAFTDTYLRFPARFIALQGQNFEEPLARNLTDKKIGVVKNTAHEKMFATYFPNALAVPYDDQNAMIDALKQKEIDAAFGDGMRLSQFLNNERDTQCCHFVGGVYNAPEFLGEGLRIAVARDNVALQNILNYTLKTLERNGKLNELYLRYFPGGFY